MKTTQNLVSVKTKVKHNSGALFVGFTVLALVIGGIARLPELKAMYSPPSKDPGYSR